MQKAMNALSQVTARGGKPIIMCTEVRGAGASAGVGTGTGKGKGKGKGTGTGASERGNKGT